MNLLSHQSAKSSHYNNGSEQYDTFNEKKSEEINQVLEKIFERYRVKTALDLTCGTGSQVFWLAKRGYEMTGSDFNSKMLKIAKDKAKKGKLHGKFLKGDMRNLELGNFDAVITIFNSVGHLTKLDFEKAMQNIYKNLNKGGIYVFDIFNLNYLMQDNNITDLTIDWQKATPKSKVREIQYSTINKNGVLASYITHIEELGSSKPKLSRSYQTLQVYTAKQLKEMLQENGFKVLRQCAVDGSRFLEKKSDRILTIAKKH
jgi:ubiquinone/menaquinone biosynthesis C-methylase UbiE